PIIPCSKHRVFPLKGPTNRGIRPNYSRSYGVLWRQQNACFSPKTPPTTTRFGPFMPWCKRQDRTPSCWRPPNWKHALQNWKLLSKADLPPSHHLGKQDEQDSPNTPH